MFVVKESFLYMVSMSGISLKVALYFKKMSYSGPNKNAFSPEAIGFLLFVWVDNTSVCVCLIEQVVLECIFYSGLSLLYPSVSWLQGGVVETIDCL